MRKLLLAIWLPLPLAAWAYHEGPGQEGLKLDEVDLELVVARDAVVDEDWAAAVEHYEAALEALPVEREHDNHHLRLALNQARMMNKQLPLAHKELATLVKEMVGDEKADVLLLEEARRAQASSQYYITWLMRLEGYTREEWEPEIEAARQTYRLLAEQADARGDEVVAKKSREDLEAAVLLARMDLEELQGLPLPSQ